MEMNKVFARVFPNKTIILQMQTKAADIAGWDSLHHLQIVIALETHFKLRFTTNEILLWKKIENICEDIAKRIERKC